MQTTIMNIFSTNVRRHLELQGLSIQELSDACGIARSNLSRILHGHENVTLERAERIAEALEVTLAELVTAPRKAAASA
jgi:transcriptional regulator with XRE-family HTH domain